MRFITPTTGTPRTEFPNVNHKLYTKLYDQMCTLISKSITLIYLICEAARYASNIDILSGKSNVDLHDGPTIRINIFFQEILCKNILRALSRFFLVADLTGSDNLYRW